MRQLDDNLWIRKYPLSVLGTDHGRTVTLIRLSTGRLIIHSMAPFTAREVAEIRSLGEPGWLVEAMLLHDTYAREGREAFPEVPFHGPEGFSRVVKFPVLPLVPPPSEWAPEIQVIALRGIPRLREHALIHKPSRTLVVADLIFNFDAGERGWNRFFHRHIAGMKRYPAMSRVFRWCIANRARLRESLNDVFASDFDRIIPGHGEVIERDGKELLRRALSDAEV